MHCCEEVWQFEQQPASYLANIQASSFLLESIQQELRYTLSLECAAKTLSRCSPQVRSMHQRTEKAE